jgi:hypothetical protein
MMSQRSMQGFSITIIVALLFCQVIGAWCPMVPTAVAAGLGGHRLHAMHHRSAHSMAGEAMCPDTLTSTRDGNSEKLDQTWILPDPSLEGSSHDVSKGAFASSARDVGLEVHSKIPRYGLLSTFRI